MTLRLDLAPAKPRQNPKVIFWFLVFFRGSAFDTIEPNQLIRINKKGETRERELETWGVNVRRLSEQFKVRTLAQHTSFGFLTTTMGRRRKTGDTASKSYRKYPPTDITLAKRSFFIRIRRWYAMQTSRLRRPDAVKSRPLPSLSLIFLSFLFLSFDTQTISIGFQLIWGAHSMGKQGVSCVLCSINPVAGVVLLCLSKSAAFHFSCFDTRCPNRPRFSF